MLKETDSARLAELVPEFDFLMRRLVRLNVLEYKGPYTTLTWEHCDTAMAYAFLAKRKHGGPDLGQVALHFLYSYRSKDLLDIWQRNGFPMIEEEPGVFSCCTLPMKIYLMNLVELSDRRPDNLINLLSARHRRFVQEHLQDRLPGQSEVLQDIQELGRRFAAELTLEERLAGLPPEERLKGLSPQELARLRALLNQIS